MSVLATVEQLKRDNQDWEFYPTSKPMLRVIKRDILSLMPYESYGRSNKYPNPSFLDIGAGNGSSLEFLTSGDRFAIEKSKILIDLLSRDIVVVGTEFNACTLIDKRVDVVFCNPPYSEYESWMNKVIKEANCLLIYFIVPSRWNKSQQIKEALKVRKAEVEILKSTDFLDADRKARAKVDILRVDLARIKEGFSRYRGETPTVDPFDAWFDAEFPFTKETEIKFDKVAEGETLKDKVANQLVAGRGLIDVLVELYNVEMKHLFDTYKAIASLDPVVLKEIEVNVSHVKAFIKQKIEGLKHQYWHEFFDNYASITDRLTSKSRNMLLNKLHSNVHVDFTASNAYAITCWVLKNANAYFDSQLVSVFQDMIKESNVIKYVSNKNVFKDEKHRYNWQKCYKAYGKVALDYRIVITKGGISNESYESSRFNGLSESAFHFVNDLLVIGNNLGYSFPSWIDAGYGEEWTSGLLKEFYAVRNEERVLFMTVRAYMNGNLHIKFNQSFMRQLNVMHGKLKGWVKDWQDIEREFNFSDKKHQASKVTASEAGKFLSTGNFQLHGSNVQSLLLGQVDDLEKIKPKAIIIPVQVNNLKPKERINLVEQSNQVDLL